MPRFAMLLWAVLGTVAVTASAVAQPAAAGASTVSSVCVKPRPTRPVVPRPAADPLPAAEVHVNVACEAPRATGAATGSGTSASASTSASPPTPSTSSSSSRAIPPPTERPASAPSAPPNPLGLFDRLKLVAAFAAVLLLIVGLRVLLHALDVPLLWRRREAGEGAATQATEGFMFRRHWGSFGGESTGWNMSARLARLLSGAALVSCALALLILLLDEHDEAVKRSEPATQSVAKADKVSR